MSRYVRARLRARQPETDPRCLDPEWAKARRRASDMAVGHFACRGDATEVVILSFIHRETQRLLGEPVTELFYGWGRTRDHQVKPAMPPELRMQLDEQRRHQWKR